MARGELMKKLLASYGRDDEFRAVAEQIINEEEKKNNRVLARSLRKTLEAGPSRPSGPKALAPLIPFPEAAADFIERIEPQPYTQRHRARRNERARAARPASRSFAAPTKSGGTDCKVRSKLCSAVLRAAARRCARRFSRPSSDCRSFSSSWIG